MKVTKTILANTLSHLLTVNEEISVVLSLESVFYAKTVKSRLEQVLPHLRLFRNPAKTPKRALEEPAGEHIAVKCPIGLGSWVYEISFTQVPKNVLWDDVQEWKPMYSKEAKEFLRKYAVRKIIMHDIELWTNAVDWNTKADIPIEV